MAPPKLLASLDMPAYRTLSPGTRFGGWYMPDHDQPPKLTLLLEEEPHAGLISRAPRPDVDQVYPDRPDAMLSGYYGDLVLSPSVNPGDLVKVEIRDEAGSFSPIQVFSGVFEVVPGDPAAEPRTRSFDLEAILRLPMKEQALPGADLQVFLRQGCPHFLPRGWLPVVRLTQEGLGHPHSEAVQQIVKGAGDGLILDFGAGRTPDPFIRSNICYLDVHQYTHTDIVCGTPLLPFRDNVFDVVISQATFEHLQDPHRSALELLRVLKAGGTIHVETAFMQPKHADPGHYFNMTVQGLRSVMKPFGEVRSGVLPHQSPSWGLRMQTDAVLPYVKDKTWAAKMKNFKDWLSREGDRLDEALGPEAREMIAAGVFFTGRKSV